MLLQRSKLAVTHVERPRLASPYSIALLGVLVVAALVAIYPHQNLVNRIYQAPASQVTASYLDNLLRTDPGNPRLRLMLARSHLQLGAYGKVHDTVAPALASDDDALRTDATILIWEANDAQLAKLPAGSPERARLLTRLRGELAELAQQELPPDLLPVIARKAFAIGLPALGLNLFERLAAGSDRSGQWYAEAARTALGHGEYRAAAQFFLIARERSANLATARAHFLDALRALRFGDLAGEAIDLADRTIGQPPSLLDDTQTLAVMVELARAARRPDLADKYARRLLRLALLEQWRRAQLAKTGMDAVLRRVAVQDEELRGSPRLPFDDRIYRLGFDAFLDNKKLDDAWQVAASAVRQAPENLDWRERLAKVSEWTGRPQMALENWLYLAQSSGRDEAWQAVLRLAPGLFDDSALRAALQRELARRPGDRVLIREIVALYERAGDPTGALLFLDRQHAASRQAWLLADMAGLAERSGDDARALRLWKRLLADGRPDTDQIVHIATLLLLNGDNAEAIDLLDTHRQSAGAEETGYWRLAGEVGRKYGRDELALAAYRQATQSRDAVAADFDALHALLLDDYPLDAARVVAAAFRRFGQTAHAVRALATFAAEEAWSEAGRLLGELDARQLDRLRRSPDFLRYSGLYHQHQGRLAAARRDLELALKLAPDDTEVQRTLLWIVIDGNDAVTLRRMLAQIEPAARDNPVLHDTLAAAYQLLSRPDVALKRYLTPQLAHKHDDFLWLMNYADALEQNQEADRAWRLRRHLLAGQRQLADGRTWLTGSPAVPLDVTRRVARARLALHQRQGDPSLAVMRELLRLDRDGERHLSNAARQVAAGWLQDHGEYQAERGWLWQQYARNAMRPLWADITVALVEDDRETLGDLLDRFGESLPRYDRINAARRVDDLRLAQTDAFDTQTDQPDDDPLHLQLTEALLAHSDHLGGTVASRDVGGLGEREIGVLWHLSLSPRLSLDLGLGSIARRNHDTAVIGAAPDETYRSARLNWRHADGETRFGIGQRDSLARYHPLSVEHEQRLDERLRLRIGIGHQLPATDTTALRVAGMKDRAFASLSYRPTLRDRLTVEYAAERYATQTDSKLGDGRHFSVEVAHALRLEPRDLELSVFWSHHGYSRRDAAPDPALLPLLPAGLASVRDLGPNFFVPDSFSYGGIRLSTDSRFAHEYTRAWRPYATVARTWHSALGPGYDLAFGIAGSVFGADHLRLGGTLGRSGLSGGGLVREIGITYRQHY